jgi:hypothetical protein
MKEERSRLRPCGERGVDAAALNAFPTLLLLLLTSDDGRRVPQPAALDRGAQRGLPSAQAPARVLFRHHRQASSSGAPLAPCLFALAHARPRRTQAPRKSILKFAADPSGGDDDDGPLSARSVVSARPRVSFASHAHVRVFEKKEPRPSGLPDENAYPGGRPRKSALRVRRSSVGQAPAPGEADGGEADMEQEEADMDMDMDVDDEEFDFLPSDATEDLAGLEAAPGDVDDDEDDGDANGDADGDAEADDMDVTRRLSVPANARRSSVGGAPAGRRSSSAFSVWEDGLADGGDDLTNLGMAPGSPQKPRGSLAMSARAPLSARPSAAMDISEMADLSGTTGGYGEQSADVTTEHEEYNHPIEKALRPPAPPSAALLALMAETNGADADADAGVGDDSLDAIAGDMPLEAAYARLSIARSSLGAAMDLTTHAGAVGDDSFSSTEGDGDGPGADATLTLGPAWYNGRPSVGLALAEDALLDATDELAAVGRRSDTLPTPPAGPADDAGEPDDEPASPPRRRFSIFSAPASPLAPAAAALPEARSPSPAASAVAEEASPPAAPAPGSTAGRASLAPPDATAPRRASLSPVPAVEQDRPPPAPSSSAPAALPAAAALPATRVFSAKRSSMLPAQGTAGPSSVASAPRPARAASLGGAALGAPRTSFLAVPPSGKAGASPRKGGPAVSPRKAVSAPSPRKRGPTPSPAKGKGRTVGLDALESGAGQVAPTEEDDDVVGQVRCPHFIVPRTSLTRVSGANDAHRVLQGS